MKKLKKGSAAAKAYMAKLRAMAGRKKRAANPSSRKRRAKPARRGRSLAGATSALQRGRAPGLRKPRKRNPAARPRALSFGQVCTVKNGKRYYLTREAGKVSTDIGKARSFSTMAELQRVAKDTARRFPGHSWFIRQS